MNGQQSPLIVCFGDSLTVGYQSPTREEPQFRETPYAAFLQEMLGRRARLQVSGVCGEVTGEMALRFRRDVLGVAPAYVVILGGSNDLGWNAQPTEIMRNLLKMYEQALASTIRPVAVTVPSIRAETGDGEHNKWLDSHIARRRTLNGLIEEYCRRKDVACIDLFGATAESPSCCLAAEYSNDGLHLTTAGYQRLAELLYYQVFANL